MKQYVYFASYFYMRHNGETGNGMAEQSLNEPISSLQQVMEMASAIEKQEGLRSVAILHYQIMRVDEPAS